MYAYKTAVAVKELGFHNIKIYNGGIKDWKKSGFPVESRSPLPEYPYQFISATELNQLLSAADIEHCGGTSTPRLMLLDLRNEPLLEPGGSEPFIATTCPTQFMLFDDLLKAEVREKLPKNIPLVSITETGNRDDLIMRFLSGYGYANVKGLQYGMRGWIKEGLPITNQQGKP